MSRAKRTVVVADATRLGRVALAQIAPLQATDQVITNTGADEVDVQRLRAAGLEVV